MNAPVGGQATQLAITTQPSNSVAGQNINSSGGVVVTVRDASGNTASGYSGSVTLALSSNPGGGTLSGTKTVTAVNGVATFTGISREHHVPRGRRGRLQGRSVSTWLRVRLRRR